MKLTVLLLILSSVAISALAQICLKHGMNHGVIQRAIAETDPITIALAVGSNPFVIGGLVLYGLGAVLWLAVLAQADLSLAFPFVALGFLIAMVLSVLMLGEHLNAAKVIGTAMIMLGVLVLARG